MALVHLPTAATLRELAVADNRDPATVTEIDPGLTTDPAQFVVPAVQITESRTAAAMAASATATRQSYMGRLGFQPPQPSPGPQAREQYAAQLMITRHAAEGSNKSIYLAKGVYETNCTLRIADYLKAKVDPDREGVIPDPASWLEQWTAGKPRVYFFMPQSIADLNRQAEIEHCNDFLLAYQLTLGALEHALGLVAAGVHLPPQPSAPLARTALLAHLQHQLPAGLQGVAQNLALCGQKYTELCAKSKERDKGWHTFGFEYLGPAPHPPSVHYLTGKARPENGCIFLQYTKGESEIGLHSSPSIIHF